MPLPATRWSRAASRLTLAAAVTFPTVIAVGGTAAAAASRGQPGTAAASASGGTLRGWGLGSQGQLGNGHRTSVQPTPVRVRLAPGVSVTSVRAGCDHTLALTSNGRMLAWGRNSEGELGNGTRTAAITPVRVRLPKGARFRIIAAGCAHSLAVSTHGQLYAWGFNGDGQLGDDSTTSTDVPVKVSLPGPAKGGPRARAAATPRVVSLFGGLHHSLALLSDGVLLAWGGNLLGELGDGTGESSDVPVQVELPGGTKVTAIAAGLANGLVLISTHRLWAWGDNSAGELGSGTSAAGSNVPVLVSMPAGLRVTGIGGGAGASTLFAIAHRR